MVFRIALLAGIVIAHTANAGEDTNLQRANMAFHGGQYRQALSLYRQAEKQGISQPAVDYNIAVCLYRLGQYEAAAKAFKPLLELTRWQGLAQYNLGLVYQAEGKSSQAAHWFRQAEKKPNPAKIRQLARRKLNLIAEKEARQKNRNRVALYRIGIGYDDNPASATDETSQQSNNFSDRFNELMIYGHVYLAGQKNNGLKLYALGFSRQYRDYQQYDTHLAGLGLMYETALASFDTGYGIQFTHIRTDQGTLANQAKLKLEAGYRAGADYWQIALAPSFYRAGDNYQQVEGWQERFDISWKHRFDPTSIKLRYRYEANQREDLSIGNRFYSYSPKRQSLRAYFDWQLSKRWQLKWYSEYQDNQYRDQNSLTDSDGQFKTQQRDNKQIQHQLQLKYRIVKGFSISSRFKYRDVDDNYLLYTYSKKEALLSLELLL